MEIREQLMSLESEYVTLQLPYYYEDYDNRLLKILEIGYAERNGDIYMDVESHILEKGLQNLDGDVNELKEEEGSTRKIIETLKKALIYQRSMTRQNYLIKERVYDRLRALEKIESDFLGEQLKINEKFFKSLVILCDKYKERPEVKEFREKEYKHAKEIHKFFQRVIKDARTHLEERHSHCESCIEESEYLEQRYKDKIEEYKKQEA